MFKPDNRRLPTIDCVHVFMTLDTQTFQTGHRLLRIFFLVQSMCANLCRVAPPIELCDVRMHVSTTVGEYPRMQHSSSRVVSLLSSFRPHILCPLPSKFNDFFCTNRRYQHETYILKRSIIVNPRAALSFKL